jgi:FkbM family methyltransferase
VNSSSFDSYSQNAEDVVLRRALRGVEQGRYIDVGAYHPSIDSVSMAFYKLGWQGIAIEPDPDNARLQREMRPRDIQIEAAITAKDSDMVTLHVVEGTGLSTLDDTLVDIHRGSGQPTHDIEVPTRRVDRILEELGWQNQDIHFMSIDTEGSERGVLESTDLSSWRPWILVVEATEPNTTKSTRHLWEDILTDAKYVFCLFDGLSCFFLAEEHQELSQALTYPACVLDNFTTLTFREQARRAEMVPTLIEDVARWRTESVKRWASTMAEADTVARLRSELGVLQQQNEAFRMTSDVLQQQVHGIQKQVSDLHQSTSWRVTRPLRSVSGLRSRSWARK